MTAAVGFRPHEEAVIQHFMEDPELAEIMLQDTLADGDDVEVQKIQRRIQEATKRTASMSYWSSLIDNAEQTARDGKNLDAVIGLVTRALGILKAAVPANA